MRIGITLQSLDPTWGGIGIYTQEIVRSLLALDRHNEYVLMYPGFGAARKLYRQYRKYRNVQEIETYASRVPSGWYWDQVVVPAVAEHHRIDVLFNPFLSVPIRGRFGKVLIMHNVEYHTVPRVYDWKMYTRWFLLEKAILPAADRVISISQTMTRDFRRAVRYPIEKVRTIYHGVSPRFRPVDDKTALDAAREEYRLPESFILFVGHLYPQKNFSTLLRAFHRIRDRIGHSLVVAGRPRWKYEGDLRLIDELQLRDRVEFLYHVPNDSLPTIYSLASCLVYPSLYESFGLVQLEAMACGCPVLGARAGAIPEVAGDAAVLFDASSPDDLAAALLRVIEDANLRAGLVERGFARAAEFTWERCASQTLAVLEEAGRARSRR
jgi:glycosyltransferase involved in cell wall biosynthesis